MKGSREFTKRVGRRIRFYRDEAGLSTFELARLMGISEPMLKRHIYGETEPNIETIARYAVILKVTVSDLIPQEYLPEWPPRDSNSQPTDVWFDLAGAR